MADGGEFVDHLFQTLRNFLPDIKLTALEERLKEGPLNVVSTEKFRDWLRSQHANTQDHQSDNREKLAASVQFLVQCAGPPLSKGQDFEGGWNDKEMMEYCSCASAVMRICHILLSALFGGDNQDKIENGEATDLLDLRKILMKRISCCLVSLCAAHVNSHPWTNETSRTIAKDLLVLICSNCRCASVSELLSGSVEEESNSTQKENRLEDRQTVNRVFPLGLLRSVLDYLRPFLHKDTWKKSPVVCHVLVWCTMKVKHPYLGEHFSKLMPPLLLFIDDYEVENKVLGLTCLKHVVDNVNSAELLWYGRADVLFEAVQRLLYTNDPSLILALHPCVLSILTVIEPSPKKPKQGRKTTKCDGVFQVILSSMEFENKIAMRRAYTYHLKTFVEHMGITVLRHFKRLLRIVVSYLEVSDYPDETARLAVLETLNAVMLHAWPRIPHHSSTILKSLLKLIVDMTDSSPYITDQAYQQLKDKTTESLLILRRCCGKQVEDQLRELKKDVGHKEVEECVTKALQQSDVEDCVTIHVHEANVT